MGPCHRSVHPLTLQVVAALVAICVGVISTGAAEDLAVRPDSVLPTVVELVSARTGVDVAAAECPEGVPLRAGEVFECSARGDGGTRFTVVVRIVDAGDGGFTAVLLDPLAREQLVPRAEGVLARLADGAVDEVHDAAGPEIRDALTREQLSDFVACQVDHLGGYVGLDGIETAFVHREDGEGFLKGGFVFEHGLLVASFQWRRTGDDWTLASFSLMEPEAPNRRPDLERLTALSRELLTDVGAGRWSEVRDAFAPRLRRSLDPDSVAEGLAPVTTRLGGLRSLEVESVEGDAVGFPVLVIGVLFEGGPAVARLTWAPCGHGWRLSAYELTPVSEPPPVTAG